MLLDKQDFAHQKYARLMDKGNIAYHSLGYRLLMTAHLAHSTAASPDGEKPKPIARLEDYNDDGDVQ